MAYGTYEIKFDKITRFYYSIVTEEDLLSVLGGSSSITDGGNSALTFSNYSSDPHYKICNYCYNNYAAECDYDVDREGTKMYLINRLSNIPASKLVTSHDDIFSKNKTTYIAFTVHGIAIPKVDGNNGAFDDITVSVVDQEIGALDIPITGDVSMSYCGDNSYISVNDTKYLKGIRNIQELETGAQLSYVCYHGYTIEDSPDVSSRRFACTMLYKVVFSTSYWPAEIYRTSIKNESKIILNLSTNPSNNSNYRMRVSGHVKNQGETTGTTNYGFYDFYIMNQTSSAGGTVEDTKYSLALTFNRGSYPFSYNFSVLGNKILPANKNYYLCKSPARANSEILNGEIIDFYFLQNYENDMTPSSCEVDIMYDSSVNENVVYTSSDSAAAYLTEKPENFVYPIFKNEADELVHYTTFLDNLKYLTVSDPASSNATSIASGFTVPIPAVAQSIDFASPENCSATHTPFGYTYQYKIDVKPKEGLPEEISNMTKKYTLNFNFLYYGSGIPYTDSSICLSTLNDYKGFDTSGEDDPNKALTGENIITHSITNMPDNASSTLWYGIYKTEGTPGITGFALYNNTSDAQAISPDNDATRCISKQYVPFQIVGTDRPSGTASYTIPTSGGITGEYSSDKPRLISISGNAVS